MTRRAGTRSATLGLDARNIIAEGCLLHGRPVLGLDRTGIPAGVGISDLRHEKRSVAGLTAPTGGARLLYSHSVGDAIPNQWARMRAEISARTSSTACASSAIARLLSPGLALATSSASAAARATRIAPIPTADPFNVWASVTIAAGSLARMRSSNSSDWRSNN